MLCHSIVVCRQLVVYYSLCCTEGHRPERILLARIALQSVVAYAAP